MLVCVFVYVQRLKLCVIYACMSGVCDFCVCDCLTLLPASPGASAPQAFDAFSVSDMEGLDEQLRV